MLHEIFRRFVLPVALTAAFAPALADPGAAASAVFGPGAGHELRRLHADELVKLGERFGGQPVLVVNTASRCGFTDQFRELEAVHRKYKDRGLKVAGFPSDDFRQEAADESKTAEVCFENFGVTFDMFAPIAVTGDKAHPLFREIARQASAPRWNFHKYLIDRSGQTVRSFPSATEPHDPAFVRELEKMIQQLAQSIRDKDDEIAILKADLSALDKAYTRLFDAYQEKAELVDELTEKLNTVYYTYGTEDELVKNQVLERKNGFIGIGKKIKLVDNFNEKYFAEIDLTKENEIFVEGSDIKIITDHPSRSYTLVPSGKNTKIKISNPREFWKVSNYLVVVVD